MGDTSTKKHNQFLLSIRFTIRDKDLMVSTTIYDSERNAIIYRVVILDGFALSDYDEYFTH